MTVKELKQRLENANDDAVVILYDGAYEGDTFATTTLETKRKYYSPYCRGDSFTCDVDDNVDLFVIAGWNTGYEYLNARKDQKLEYLTRKKKN